MMDIETMAQIVSGGNLGMIVHDNGRLRKAVIEGDAVVNIIICAADFELPGKLLVDAGDADIGWRLVDGALVPPEPGGGG